MAKEVRFSREEIYEKIWQTPAMRLASELSISDVALGKICRKMDVPKPPRGYWRRIERGAQIRPIPLPKSKESTIEFVYLMVRAEKDEIDLNFEMQAVLDRAALPENKVTIGENLDDAHPLVAKSKAFCENSSIVELEPIVFPNNEGFLNISVSSHQMQRALLIMDALIKALESSGYEVEVSSDHWGEDTRIMKEGEAVRIYLYEKAKKVSRELTAEETKKPSYLLDIPVVSRPSGKLTLKMKVGWSDYQTWSDRKDEPLEDRLNELLVGIALPLEHLVAEKRKRKEVERRRRELILQQEEEKRLREQLERDANLWHKSERITKYLDAFEAGLVNANGAVEPDSKEADWLNWARGYAASLNPLTNPFDEEKDED